MYLYQYLCVLSFKQQLVYVECNHLINFSLFSIRKFKTKTYLINVIDNSSFFIYCSSFFKITNFTLYWKRIYPLIQSFFVGGVFGYLHGFRLLGRGYKAYLHLNNYAFRLGYSHNIYYVLPLLYKTTKKEKSKNFWKIRGTNKISLSNIISTIRNFRIPNAYRFKGIYRINETYRLKLTKKGSAL